MRNLQNRVYAAGADRGNIALAAEILVCALLTAGIAGILCSFSGSTLADTIILAESVIVSIIIAFVRKNPMVSHIFHAAMVILFAVNVLIGLDAVRSAMLSDVNNIITTINNTFDKEIALLGAEPASALATLLFHGILAAAAAMLVSFLVNRGAVIAISVLSLILLIIGIVLELPYMIVVMPLILIGWIGCWSMCVTGGGRSMIVVCGTMALLFGIGFGISAAVGFSGFELFTDFKKAAEDKIYEIRFGSDTLPHGDLLKADKLLSSEKDTLTVRFDKPETLYLKGFTGGSFEESRWIEYKNDAYLGEWNGMLDYFEDNNFTPQKMYSKYISADGSSPRTNRITVDNVGADRCYEYLPFTAADVTSSGSRAFKDLTMKNGKFFGARSYSFTNIMTEQSTDMLNPSSWAKNNGSLTRDEKSYIEKENTYRAFVNDTYLDIDEKTRDEVNEVFFRNFDTESEKIGVYGITSRIRAVLSLATDYIEEPKKPDDKDFIGWFLGSYRKGNSVYYATTAVMAYRAAGVPARYAEGYIVSEADVKNMTDSGARKIKLTGKNAHAWVEIYRDGIGWVSVDVTPGFYTEDKSMNEIIDMSKEIGDIGGMNGSGSEHFTNALSRYSPQKAERPEKMSVGMRILLSLALLAIIFVFAMYIRYIYIIYKKYVRTYGEPNAYTTTYMMEYICAMLSADGIDALPDKPGKFKEELLEKYPNFSENEFDRVMALIGRSSYGGARLRENELRTIRIFMEKLRADVYKRKSILNKFIMKYIKIV